MNSLNAKVFYWKNAHQSADPSRMMWFDTLRELIAYINLRNAVRRPWK